MDRLLLSVLTRRSLLKSGAVAPVLFLAGCSYLIEEETEAEPSPTSEPEIEIEATPTPEEEPTATPAPDPSPTPEPTPEPTEVPEEELEPVSLYIDSALDVAGQSLVRESVDRLESLGSELGIEIELTSDGASANVALFPRNMGPTGRTPLIGEPLIPVVRPDHLVDSVWQEQMTNLFNGTISNWSDLGGQDRDVHPVLSQSLATPFTDTDADRHPHDDLVAFAADNPGMIALIPRSAASIHVQSLIVDEIDPIRDELDTDNWPLWDSIEVLVDHPDEEIHDQLLDVLMEGREPRNHESRSMISVTGDVMLGRTPHRIMVERNDWTAPFPLVADELQKGDLTVGNLECAITDSFEPPADPTTFSFMTFTQAVEGLELAGFHALSGANNHALDFGVVGMRDTTAALEAAGIQHFGTGDNLEQARQPCLLEHNGVTFGFLGYDAISMQYAGATAESGGVAPLVREYVMEDIERTREVADVVIPYFHWGIEYTLTPTEFDRRTAHMAVEAGADLVLGGHPHWVQGMEIYQNRAIFYSTSNFVFDQEWSLETKQGFVLHLIFDGTTLIGYRVVPVLIEDFHRPRIVEDDVRDTILGRFWESSQIISNTPYPQ